MPTFVELQKQLKRRKVAQVRFGADEILIADERAAMRPGDFVHEKLRAVQDSDTARFAMDSSETSMPAVRRFAKPR